MNFAYMCIVHRKRDIEIVCNKFMGQCQTLHSTDTLKKKKYIYLYIPNAKNRCSCLENFELISKVKNVRNQQRFVFNCIMHIKCVLPFHSILVDQSNVNKAFEIKRIKSN